MARAGRIGRQFAGSAAGDVLATELLTAAAAGQGAAGLAERIVAAPPPEALAAVAALGHSREAAAAPILVAIAEGAGAAPKELRKEARRELHRLRAQGLDVPRPSPPPPPSPTAARPAEAAEAWATAPDGIGSRALWLVAERPLGGVYAIGTVLNDVVGMKACTIEDTTRKRFNQRLAAIRADAEVTWVELPPSYAGQLIGEALELNQESGFAVPQEYQVHRPAIADLVRPFERALVYDEISPAEATLNPELLEQSPALLDEEELKGWFFGFDEVRSFALDLLQARQSQIVLSEELRAEREERIIANAIREAVTPPLQRALRRRLEETAHVFLKTGRELQARRALAAAQRLSEGALTLHPLLRAVMQKSLELATEVETAKVPVELVRRSPYDPIE